MPDAPNSGEETAAPTAVATAAKAPTMGLFRTAHEAAVLGEDSSNKVFVITGAYSGLGV